MSLLLNILQNPDKWPDTPETQLETHQQHIASSYNESLKKSKKLGREPLKKPGEKEHQIKTCIEVAKENEELIKKGYVRTISHGFIEQISLSCPDFEQDIKNAITQLR